MNAMPEQRWQEFRVKELCLGIYDGPHATPAKTVDGPIFLGISNLRNGRLDLSEVEHLSESDFASWTRRVTPRPGDVVFSYETRLGEAAIIPDDMRCCLGRRMALMRPDPERVDARFLLYAYLGPYFQEVIRSRTIPGSTVDRIPLIEFPDFPIRVPDLAEQRRIARILGTLDDKIELNRRMNRTLEETARAVFRSWFVDFDPVRAKAAGRAPEGMDAATAALFPSEFVGSEVGEIPQGWIVERLDQVIEMNPTRSIDRQKAVPYLDMSNMPTSGHRALNWIDRPFGSGTKFRNGDVLVARITPCLENGKTALVDFLMDEEVGWGSTEYIVMHPRTPLSSEWVYLLARTEEFRSHAIQSMTGSSGRQRVAAQAVAQYGLVVPPERIVEQFGRIILPMIGTIKSRDDQNRTLAELRNGLLPRLLSGEIQAT